MEQSIAIGLSLVASTIYVALFFLGIRMLWADARRLEDLRASR
jgi:hypothetical protein